MLYEYALYLYASVGVAVLGASFATVLRFAKVPGHSNYERLANVPVPLPFVVSAPKTLMTRLHSVWHEQIVGHVHAGKVRHSSLHVHGGTAKGLRCSSRGTQ